jgi:hypothetical protein
MPMEGKAVTIKPIVGGLNKSQRIGEQEGIQDYTESEGQAIISIEKYPISLVECCTGQGRLAAS